VVIDHLEKVIGDLKRAGFLCLFREISARRPRILVIFLSKKARFEALGAVQRMQTEVKTQKK